MGSLVSEPSDQAEDKLETPNFPEFRTIHRPWPLRSVFGVPFWRTAKPELRIIGVKVLGA